MPVILCLAWLLVSFWNRNELPQTIEPAPGLLDDPRQTETRAGPFGVTYEGVEYRVEPEYEYELYGLIVSYRHHDDSRLHLLSGDHLNMLDVCVIWGQNLGHPNLDRLNFWNGIFTCMVETQDREAWRAFDMHQISNNHLISDDETIRDGVRGIDIGDQVRIRGKLASYVSPGGRRGTSTTRVDEGNGACETIWVEQFEIVEPATGHWRVSMYASLMALLLSLFLYFRQPYRPFRNA